LTIVGSFILLNADLLLAISQVNADLENKARLYLQILALGLPASMGMRVLMSFHNAVSRPGIVTILQLIGLGLKFPLNALFIYGGFGIDAMGGPGCAVATVIINWLWFFSILIIVLWGRFYKPFLIFERFSWPNWHRIGTLLRLGTPIGLSYFIEVTSFTFMSLFIARLGTTTLAGHQIVANLGTVIYMVPLSLAIATMTLVAQSIGAGKQHRAEEIGWSSVLFTGGLCIVIGLLVWVLRFQLLDMYDPTPDVKLLAAPLFLFICFYQLVDSVQVVAAFILRAYRISFLPMIVYAGSLWCIGLGGGYLLGFNVFGNTPTLLQGVNGFWIANSVSLAVAAALLLWIFKKTANYYEKTNPPVTV
jgi:MATE family multidrug resistance protein